MTNHPPNYVEAEALEMDFLAEIPQSIDFPDYVPRHAEGTEARLCADVIARQQVGKQTYGGTVEQLLNSPLECARHAYHEALDQAIYLRRLMELLEAKENTVL